MTNDVAEQFLARLQSARTKGMKSMWYMVFAGIVLEMLKDGEPVTADALRAVFRAGTTKPDSEPFWREAYQAALETLDEAVPPRD